MSMALCNLKKKGNNSENVCKQPSVDINAARAPALERSGAIYRRPFRPPTPSRPLTYPGSIGPGLPVMLWASQY